jgi:hypothetical protein
VWRGLDIADTPSIQPLLAFDYKGFEAAAWGAYTISNESWDSDEIDFWLSWTKSWESEASLMLIVTDYYFPNAGSKFFNFNNHDAENPDGSSDAGAHTVEPGLSVTGPKSLPLTLSGYVNVYNDAANSAYFEIDYPFTAGELGMKVFCGAALGNADNPTYYGTDGFDVINVGVTVTREIKMSETFALPLVVSLINNPRAELTYLVVGVSF